MIVNNQLTINPVNILYFFYKKGVKNGEDHKEKDIKLIKIVEYHEEKDIKER
jgi:hypothetical protein